MHTAIHRGHVDKTLTKTIRMAKTIAPQFVSIVCYVGCTVGIRWCNWIVRLRDDVVEYPVQLNIQIRDSVNRLHAPSVAASNISFLGRLAWSGCLYRRSTLHSTSSNWQMVIAGSAPSPNTPYRLYPITQCAPIYVPKIDKHFLSCSNTQSPIFFSSFSLMTNRICSLHATFDQIFGEGSGGKQAISIRSRPSYFGCVHRWTSADAARTHHARRRAARHLSVFLARCRPTTLAHVTSCVYVCVCVWTFLMTPRTSAPSGERAWTSTRLCILCIW